MCKIILSFEVNNAFDAQRLINAFEKITMENEKSDLQESIKEQQKAAERNCKGIIIAEDVKVNTIPLSRRNPTESIIPTPEIVEQQEESEIVPEDIKPKRKRKRK